MLLLDAGNALFGQRLAIASQGQIIIEAMNAMGYDAMAVGTLDLRYGLNVLLQRAKEARFALLSCNLVYLDTQQPVLQPYIILERQGVRYGVIGISEPQVIEAAPGIDQVAEALDPASSVQKYLPQVSAQSDIVILLSHLGFEEDKKLAQAVPGIDVIISGWSGVWLGEPETVGGAIIVQAGHSGEALGKLDITLDAQRRIEEYQGKLIMLNASFADDPQLKELVASYRERFPLATPASGS